jgi:hypothetical protein
MVATECENGLDRPLHKTGIREMFLRLTETKDAFDKEQGPIDGLENERSDQHDVRREKSLLSLLTESEN